MNTLSMDDPAQGDGQERLDKFSKMCAKSSNSCKIFHRKLIFIFSPIQFEIKFELHNG